MSELGTHHISSSYAAYSLDLFVCMLHIGHCFQLGWPDGPEAGIEGVLEKEAFGCSDDCVPTHHGEAAVPLAHQTRSPSFTPVHLDRCFCRLPRWSRKTIDQLAWMHSQSRVCQSRPQTEHGNYYRAPNTRRGRCGVRCQRLFVRETLANLVVMGKRRTSSYPA